MQFLKFTLAVLLCLFCLPFAAQDQSTDSLLNVAQHEKNDTVRAKIYLQVASGYLNQGIADSVFWYSRKCYSLSKKNKFIKGMAVSCNFLGQAHSFSGALDSSIYYFKEAMLHFRQVGNSSREAGMLYNIGIIYMDQGNISQALDFYFQALRIKELLKDTAGIANVYTNIGHAYSTSRDTVNTLKYHRFALDLRRKIHDESGIANSLMSIGLYYQTIDHLDQALPYLKEALKMSEALREEESIAVGCYNLAALYYKQHKLDECEALFTRSLELSRKIKNPKGIASCLESLGQLNLDKGKTKEAIAMLEEAHNLAKEIDIKEIVASCGLKLAEAYDKTGDYKKAFYYLKTADAINDSLFNAENIRKLTGEGLKYEHEKEKMLLQQEQEKKEAGARAEAFKKNLIIVVSVLFLIIVSIFTYTIFNKLKENRRQKAIIEEQRNETIASINYAKRIQDAMLANADLQQRNLPEHFILFKPKDIVSGDFYWAAVADGHFYLAVCDCTGHGVPGAFLSLLNINFLSEAVNEKGITAPHDILNYVRNHLVEKMEGKRDGMDAIVVRIPLVRGNTFQLEYAAANNAPVLVKNGELMKLSKDKMPVGLGETNNSFSTFTAEANKGDLLYLYSDGFADQFGGPMGKKFKYTQLDALLLANSQKSLTEQKDFLLTGFEKWRGQLDQVDDVCVAGIKL